MNAVSNKWLVRDLLLVVVALSGCIAIVMLLTPTERVEPPKSFAHSGLKADQLRLAVADLNHAVQTRTAKNDLPVADRASDLQIYRRLSLALTGTVPSIEELREVDKVEEDRRVDWYISHLLEDRRTSDYLAERFTRAFVGVETGPFLVYRRRRFAHWMSDQIHANVPYDQIVREMLTANGLWTDSPQVNFYTYNIIADSEDETKPDPVRLAARLSRSMLGMRIDCLQCHDDFLGTMNLGSASEPVGGLQLHFHSLASFFTQVENSLVGIGDDVDAEVYRYQLLEEESNRDIEPQVPFDQERVDTAEPNLRIRLADWLTDQHNRPFARALVNRVWALMLGKGLVNPVDNIPLDGPFPQSLEVLSNRFIETGYDLQQLIRVIAHSEVFQRDSRADFVITSKHQSSGSVFPISRLRPEQVAGAIAQSTSLKTIDATSHILAQLVKFGQQNEFVERYGDQGENEFVQRNETIAQRLLMMNGNMVRKSLGNGLASVARIGLLSPSDEKVVETIYLATLTRKPTAEESRHFVAQIQPLDSSKERRNKVVDIYWTLINSTEFVWNH